MTIASFALTSIATKLLMWNVHARRLDWRRNHEP